MPFCVITPGAYGPASVFGVTVDVSGAYNRFTTGFKVKSSGVDSLVSDKLRLMTTVSSANAAPVKDADKIVAAVTEWGTKR